MSSDKSQFLYSVRHKNWDRREYMLGLVEWLEEGGQNCLTALRHFLIFRVMGATNLKRRRQALHKSQQQRRRDKPDNRLNMRAMHRHTT